jgi:hypothetical protein
MHKRNDFNAKRKDECDHLYFGPSHVDGKRHNERRIKNVAVKKSRGRKRDKLIWEWK